MLCIIVILIQKVCILNILLVRKVKCFDCLRLKCRHGLSQNLNSGPIRNEFTCIINCTPCICGRIWMVNRYSLRTNSYEFLNWISFLNDYSTLCPSLSINFNNAI